MEPRINIVTLGVSDLAKSIRFYRDGLVFPIHTQMENIAFFSLKGMLLAVYPRDELAKDAGLPDKGCGFSGITLAHNVTSKDTVDAILKQASDAGAKITQHPRITDWGGYSGYFSDPDGHLWEVAWHPSFTNDQD